MQKIRTIKFGGKCPECGKDIIIPKDINPLDFAPKVSSKIRPISLMYNYRINSIEIQEYITQKARQYCPNIQVEVIPLYTEKKRKDPRKEPHKSYSFFKIAFNSPAIDRGTEYDWYYKIGETNQNVRVVKDLYVNLIHRWGFDKDKASKWLSYDRMEELEDKFGMTESFINLIRRSIKPTLIQDVTTNEPWVAYSASAEAIINDMLLDVSTDKPAGETRILDCRALSKDILEYDIIVNPYKQPKKEDTTIRQLMMSEKA